MEAMIAELKSVPLAPGFTEILYPGELEARAEARHLREGLEIAEKSVTDLAAEAKRLGVAWRAGWPAVPQVA